MIENFEKNATCDYEKLLNFFDRFDEEILFKSDILELITKDEQLDYGGCVLLDETVQISDFYITILWFRNFIFLKNGL